MYLVYFIIINGTLIKKGLSDLESFLYIKSLIDYRHWKILQLQINAEKVRSLFDKVVLFNKWFIKYKDDENYKFKAI